MKIADIRPGAWHLVRPSSKWDSRSFVWIPQDGEPRKASINWDGLLQLAPTSGQTVMTWMKSPVRGLPDKVANLVEQCHDLQLYCNEVVQLHKDRDHIGYAVYGKSIEQHIGSDADLLEFVKAAKEATDEHNRAAADEADRAAEVERKQLEAQSKLPVDLVEAITRHGGPDWVTIVSLWNRDSSQLGSGTPKT